MKKDKIRNLVNRSNRNRMKTIIKSDLKHISDKIEVILPIKQSTIDKSLKKGVINKAQCNRYKSRLYKNAYNNK